MAGKWFQVTEARRNFDAEDSVVAYKHAIKAIDMFDTNMEEFADMWWILCQCEVRAKLGKWSLERDMRKCETLRKRVFCERRRESSAVLIARITDLIFVRRFSEATNAIAHAETLEAEYNRFDDWSCNHYWSTAILKIELERLKKHQKNLEKLIRGFEEKAVSFEQQVATAKKAETDLKKVVRGFEEKAVSFEQQVAAAKKAETEQKKVALGLEEYAFSLEQQLADSQKSKNNLKEMVHVLEVKSVSLEKQLATVKSEVLQKDSEHADAIDTLRQERYKIMVQLCCANEKLEKRGHVFAELEEFVRESVQEKNARNQELTALKRKTAELELLQKRLAELESSSESRRGSPGALDPIASLPAAVTDVNVSTDNDNVRLDEAGSEGIPANQQHGDNSDCSETADLLRNILLKQKRVVNNGNGKTSSSASSSTFEDFGSFDGLTAAEFS